MSAGCFCSFWVGVLEVLRAKFQLGIKDGRFCSSCCPSVYPRHWCFLFASLQFDVFGPMLCLELQAECFCEAQGAARGVGLHSTKEMLSCSSVDASRTLD